MTGTWKVGALAAATGTTVRALHHYDHIGLLSPSDRTAAGHRIYTASDVEQLYRISLLRGLGFALEDIAEVLQDPDWQLPLAINPHLDDTRRRAAIASRLTARLSEMSAQLQAESQPTTDQLFTALQEMTMLDGSARGTTNLLVYEDIEAAQNYLVRVFSLTGGQLEREGNGRVFHGEVRAGEQVIWLHPARPGPTDQAYGVREYGARDPEGQLWFFHSPLD